MKRVDNLRWLAQEKGEKFYSPAKPCKRGHTSERLVSSGACRACNRSATESADFLSYKRATYAKRRASDPAFVEKNRARDRKNSGVPEATRPAPATCECCGRVPDSRGLVRDHDHKTGKFRGWLCFICNSGLGFLGDDEDGIERALDYLRRSVP